MGKNHNYRNYRQMTKPVDEAVPAEVKEIIEEAAANLEVDVDECAACDEVVEVTEELPTIDTDGNAPLVGVVCNCERLNIRMEPNKKSDPVAVVNKDTVLMIEYPVDVNSEWFKVYTEAGVEGYCMTQFVDIRS